MGVFEFQRLGDILVASGAVTEAQIEEALERQRREGGRLGENLIEMGLLSEEQMSFILQTKPDAPKTLEETGIPAGQLMKMLVKVMHTSALETPSQMRDALKLPTGLINKLLEESVERQLITALGANDSQPLAETRYSLSEAGRTLARELLEESRYIGPVPVNLETFQDRIMRQRITNERIDEQAILEAFGDLIVGDEFINLLGPAINSGRCILLYGPPGNGKTSVAERIGRIFNDVIYIPYCVEIDGQILKVFDPSLHKPIESIASFSSRKASLVQEDFDQRWVPCKRPIVMAGGELTLEMLDLEFNEYSRVYESPLHIKALGGTFIIDDFGRQFVKPADLLNRWIVPLESRVDFMKLNTGKSFTIPFDELVIFSTNMAPKDLMDGAFLRRIPYKLSTEGPDLAGYKRIFQAISKAKGLEFDDEIFNYVIHELHELGGAELACYQPKFIAEQVLSACKYHGRTPSYSRELVRQALNNLQVKEPADNSLAAAQAAAEQTAAAENEVIPLSRTPSQGPD